AMWSGLTLDGVPPQVVTAAEAQMFADALYHRSFETFNDWAEAVWSVNGPSDFARNAVILNGEWPTHVALIGTGTVPVCFTNQDTVTLLGRAMVNTQAGTPAGRQGFREVV